MRRATSFLVLVLVLVPALATWAAMEVEVAKRSGFDYSAYDSFGFRAKEGVPAEHPLGERGHLFQEVSEAAAETLLERGLTLVEAGEPELWITFYGLSEEEYTAEGVTREVGPVTWVGDPDAHSARTVLHATLIVEIYDAATGERIWSGWASGSTSDPEKIRKRAAKAARKVLEEFPPE